MKIKWGSKEIALKRSVRWKSRGERFQPHSLATPPFLYQSPFLFNSPHPHFTSALLHYTIISFFLFNYWIHFFKTKIGVSMKPGREWNIKIVRWGGFLPISLPPHHFLSNPLSLLPPDLITLFLPYYMELIYLFFCLLNKTIYFIWK